MRRCDPTDTRSTSRTERIPLWMLIAAFVAGLVLLGMLKPPTASAQTPADSSVVLHWTAPGDDGNTGQAATYDLRYRTVAITGTDTTSWWNAASQVSGEPAPRSAGANDSMRVSGLTPTTTYYFMIRTSDEVPNWSGFSNLAVKTTSGDITAPAAIANLSVTGATATSISISWAAPGDDGNTGTASSYDIRYSTSTITLGNWGSATPATGEPTPASAGTTQTYTLSGLQGSQTYYIAIRTTDSSGNVSGLSNVVNRTTLDNVAPAPVRDLSYLNPLPGADLLAVASEHAR
jgi:fibronectin type III domain protein